MFLQNHHFRFRSARVPWRLLSLVVVLFCACGTLLPGISAVSVAVADEGTDDAPELTIDSLSPEIYSQGNDLNLQFTLSGGRNAGSDDDEWFIEVFIAPLPLASLSEVDHYIDEGAFPGWRIYTSTAKLHRLDGTLQGEINIPSDQMPTPEPETTGARGVTVRATKFVEDPQGEDETIESEGRSLLLYGPISDPIKTRVNVLAFDTATFGSAPVSEQELEEKEGAIRLTEELSTIPGTTLGVTSLSLGHKSLQQLDSGGETAGKAVGDAPSNNDEDAPANKSSRMTAPMFLKRWNQHFTEHRRYLVEHDTELLLLPVQDADLTLLATLHSEGLLQLALSTRQDAALAHNLTSSGISTSEVNQLSPFVSTKQIGNATALVNVSVASDEGFNTVALQALPGNAFIAPDDWPLAEQSSAITPTAPVLVDSISGETVANGDAAGITPGQDGTTRLIVSGWNEGNQLINQAVGSPAEELLIRQKLRAAIELVGLEDPDDGRELSIHLNVSRETINNELVLRVRALQESPWTQPASLESLLTAVPSSVARTTVPGSKAADKTTAGPIAHLLALIEEDYSLADTIITTSDAKTDVLAQKAPEILAPTGLGLNLGQRRQLAATAESTLNIFTKAVEVVPMSTVNMVNRDAKLPVSLTNSAGFEITTSVSVNPSDPRLQGAGAVKATIPANGQIDVQLPVKAVGSGDVEVTISAATPTGELIDSSEPFTVRVRANWEDTGTVIIGIILSILFVAGLYRTFARPNRNHRKVPPPTEPENTSEQNESSTFATQNEAEVLATHPRLRKKWNAAIGINRPKWHKPADPKSQENSNE